MERHVIVCSFDIFFQYVFFFVLLIGVGGKTRYLLYWVVLVHLLWDDIGHFELA